MIVLTMELDVNVTVCGRWYFQTKVAAVYYKTTVLHPERILSVSKGVEKMIVRSASP